MEPITFIALMWFSWGLTSMVVRDGDEDDKPTAADWNTARPSGKGGRVKAEATTEPDPEIRERIRKTIHEWIKSADGNAAAARNIRWNDSAWWRQAVFAAAWNPVRDVRDATKWAKRKHDERKTRREAQADESAGESTDQPPSDPPDPDEDDEGITHDDDTYRAGWFRWGSRREAPPTPPPTPDPEPDEYTVEFVGSRPNTPPPAALAPPQRALTAADDEDPAPDTPPTLAEPTPTTDPEGTPAMSGLVPMPGTGNGLATTGGTVATITGNGDSHEDAKDFAKRIVAALEKTSDPVDQAEKMIRISTEAAWASVDRLQEAGIGGPVLNAWITALASFGVAHETAKRLVREIDEARDAAAEAARLQSRTGDTVQDAVTAGGKSVANHTSYYGKQ